MPGKIEFFSVIDPPTSEGVRQRMRHNIDTGEPVHLLCLALNQELPKPEPQPFDFQVIHATYPGDGSRIISGTLVENGEELPNTSIIIETAANLAIQATARVVRAI